MNKFDKLFFELNDVNFCELLDENEENEYFVIGFKKSDLAFKSVINEKDGMLTIKLRNIMSVMIDFDNVDETIDKIKEINDRVNGEKTQLLHLLYTPYEEKKKYICKYLDKLTEIDEDE